jgi:hypothetical protein
MGRGGTAVVVFAMLATVLVVVIVGVLVGVLVVVLVVVVDVLVVETSVCVMRMPVATRCDASVADDVLVVVDGDTVGNVKYCTDLDVTVSGSRARLFL